MICTTEHAFRTKYSGGFDVVIGNPPYVPTEYINKSDKAYLEKRYKSAYGRINLYPIFYEKGIEVINERGLLGYITPYTILKNQYYVKARKYILEKTSLINIIDFKGLTVFEDAAVDSIIILLRKGKIRNNLFIQIYDIEDFVGGNFNTISIVQEELLTTKDFVLFKSPNDELIMRVSKNTIQLKEIVNFKQGIITGNNKKFLTNSPHEQTVKILTGSNFNRYSLNASNQYLVYDVDKLHRPRKREIFETAKKILLRQTGAYPICSIDTENYYTLDTVHNGLMLNNDYKADFILPLLNSKLLRFLYENQINETGKVFAQVKIIYIDPLPIKETTIENQQPFIEKANKMLELNTQFQQKKNEFLSRVKDNFSTRGRVPLALKVTKKLDAFYNFDFKTFIAELKKQKIAISLTEQVEWEEFFNSYKTELNNLQSEINKTDKEIDQMVYELYGLSDDEIEIVEGSDRNGK